jgi:hypothetical protein
VSIKNILYISFVTTIVVLLAYFFQYFSVLWIAMARFYASDMPPGDISILQKIYYLIIYPIIFTMFTTFITLKFNILAKNLFAIRMENYIYFTMLSLVLITLVLRFAFYLFL